MSYWILQNYLKLIEDSAGLIMPSDFQLSHFWVTVLVEATRNPLRYKEMQNHVRCIRLVSLVLCPGVVHRYLGDICLTGMEVTTSSNFRGYIHTLNSEHLLWVNTVSLESCVSEMSIGNIYISNYLNLAFRKK